MTALVNISPAFDTTERCSPSREPNGPTTPALLIPSVSANEPRVRPAKPTVDEWATLAATMRSRVCCAASAEFLTLDTLPNIRMLIYRTVVS